MTAAQFYRHYLIAYSLGNFAGYDNFATSGDLGMSVILHVTLPATGAFTRSPAGLARLLASQTADHRPAPTPSAIFSSWAYLQVRYPAGLPE